MSPLRVLTIDDEPLALRRLAVALERIPDVVHVGAASGRADAIRQMAECKPEVLLLDIKMRDGTGFDVIDALPRDSAPSVIFVTAFDDYATRAFDVSAIDYVLKPVGFERLRTALDKARHALATRDADERIAELRDVVETLRAEAHTAPVPRYESEFWVRRGVTDFVRVPVDTIDWISAEDDYVCFHAEGRHHLLRETISGMVGRLDPTRFVRIHRSTIVRSAAIAEVKRTGVATQEVVLMTGERLRVGRVHARTLRRMLA